MTRLAFRKERKTYGTQMIYTAHGFYFYKGAPIKNWLLYFPVEWLCAHWTDILNTINREDYRLAKKWLKAKRIVRLPGVGIDLEKFKPMETDCKKAMETNKEAYRICLGIGSDEKMLLSVGELSRRKNQAAVIRALKLLKKEEDIQKCKGDNGYCEETRIADYPKIKYVLCGQGDAEKKLKALSKKLGIKDQVRFL